MAEQLFSEVLILDPSAIEQLAPEISRIRQKLQEN
jgi:hypothetical protein